MVGGGGDFMGATILKVKKDMLLGRVISKVENRAYGDILVNHLG